MTNPPLILVSPNVEKKGDEFGDLSTSLSETYQAALMGVGAMPLAMPATTARDMVAACVRRADGVLLTGGEDVEPALYKPGLPRSLRRTVTVTPDGGARDLREFLLVDEVFRQRKPLLAICRGHQVLNVALGGTLVVDIARQLPRALKHRRLDRRSQIVHDVQLTADALLAKITGELTLGVNSTHHQAVAQPADILQVTGRSRDGIPECMQLKPETAHLLPFLLSVQFHPERLANRNAEHRAIFSAFAQACVMNRDKNL
ncbi:MAG: gamma-glutamyl-gamma-aminobutyrate hydrolase family protein [Verrucomicrobiae bacterium]|nr:gamma-glutamyl-gamma-aminobutyrate hydrolase family protein [Verrucomicrobiae bacterium]